MPDSNFDLSQISAEWLTKILKESGKLTVGQVTELQFLGHEATTTASVVRFTVNYSPDVGAKLPAKYFMKLSERAPEGWFYRHLASAMPNSGIIPCYAVLEGQSEDKLWLLFEDLEATYYLAEHIEPNSRDMLIKRIDLLADIHAQWWNHPRLSTDIGDYADDVPSFIRGETRKHLPIYLEAVSDILTPAWRTRLEKIMATLPLESWQTRLNERNHITLIHGDTHEFNFLYPRTADGSLTLIDWAVWHLNTGVSDIAYFLPSKFSIAEREDFIRHYHNRLLAKGVENYSWELCWQDFREAMFRMIVWVVWTHRVGLEPDLWHTGLKLYMQDFDDFDLGELLD